MKSLEGIVARKGHGNVTVAELEERKPPMNKDELKGYINATKGREIYGSNQLHIQGLYRAAHEYLELLELGVSVEDIKALVEARKSAPSGCGEGKWYKSHLPNSGGNALIDDGLEHGMFAIECEHHQADFIVTAANIIGGWGE